MITDKKRYYSLRISTKTDKSNMAAQNCHKQFCLILVSKASSFLWLVTVTINY